MMEMEVEYIFTLKVEIRMIQSNITEHMVYAL